MTDDATTNDSTDPGPDSRPGSTDPSTDQQRSGVDVSRRSFLQTAAASLASATVVDALSGTATAAGASEKTLMVVGRGPGRHTYDVRMDSGTIRKATYADPGDRAGTDRAGGELWHWNLDSYTYTGEIGHVEGNGDLSVHFLNGAFTDDDVLMVHGQGAGRHEYTMGTHDGDIDVHVLYSEEGDEDRGTGDTEHSGSPDWVTGFVLGRNEDGHFTDAPIQFLRIDGDLKFEEEK